MKLANALISVLWIALFASSLFAQTVTVGLEVGTANATVSGDVSTNVSLDNPATANGTITTVTFGWSSGCADAAKIKFFRRSGNTLTMTAERGPFAASWIKNNTVTLSPPVSVQAGDLIAIARITTDSHCGYPQGQVGVTTNGFIAFASDVTGSVSTSAGLTWTYPLALFGTSSGSTSSASPNSLQFVQQGPKLVGAGAVGGALQGLSVVMSKDGNTAVVTGQLETWVWVKSGGTWRQQAKLSESGGQSAALSGDGNTAIVGLANSGGLIWTRHGETWAQQGPKLIDSTAAGTTDQGVSVALAEDGNTAIIGGDRDNNFTGAAWIWTRTGDAWSQASNKLVGSGALGSAQQGFSVALSADGNTAILGAPNDNNQSGAAWIWRRVAGTWVEQIKLVAAGSEGRSYVGYSVALSADGNVVAVGAPANASGIGAVWTWTWLGGTWQQGSKLIASDAAGNPNQGNAVSLSPDGKTLIVGGSGDASGAGAVWIWTKTGDVWSQQGNKLVGAEPVGNAGQGNSVSLSEDGSSAIVGGLFDGKGAGAAWIWRRTGGVWAQTNKLIGSDAVGRASQGWAVALSADGNTAIVGGDNDDNITGAVWAWTRSGGVWSQQGNKLVGSDAGGTSQKGYSLALSADGNTALVGGWWASVWTRKDGVWKRDRDLVGSDAVGGGAGTAVSLSADGNTAIIGGSDDGGGSGTNGLYFGAAWIFTRKSGVWTQQGPKLVGSDAIQGKYGAYQGAAVALSADGNTAIVGGPEDDTQIGAAWIWIRSGEAWTQQGPKLVGSSVPGLPAKGNSVAISGDGNTVLIGAGDRAAGAWVWSRTGSTWIEQTRLLTCTGDCAGFAGQGNSVSLSADGNTAVVGGFPYQGRSDSASVWTRGTGELWTRQGLTVSGAIGSTDVPFAVTISSDGRTVILGSATDNSGAGAAWVFALPAPPKRRAARH